MNRNYENTTKFHEKMSNAFPEVELHTLKLAKKYLVPHVAQK